MLNKKVCAVVYNSNNEQIGFLFKCPGCSYLHKFNAETWQFNGDLENPTLSPSYLTGFDNYTKNRCHSYIKEGKIQFLSDCFHDLKGKTVDLLPFSDDD